jgi:hypothetical protein
VPAKRNLPGLITLGGRAHFVPGDCAGASERLRVEVDERCPLGAKKSSPYSSSIATGTLPVCKARPQGHQAVAVFADERANGRSRRKKRNVAVGRAARVMRKLLKDPKNGVRGGIDFRVDDKEVSVPARDPLDQLERLGYVVQKAQAESDVEWTLARQVDIEDVCHLEPIPVPVDALRLENELRLVDVHLTSVDPEDEVRAGLHRGERPKAGVAPEVEDAFPGEAAPAKPDEGRKEVPLALFVPVDVRTVEDRGANAVEVELVMPLAKARNALSKLGLVHACRAPSLNGGISTALSMSRQNGARRGSRSSAAGDRGLAQVAAEGAALISLVAPYVGERRKRQP